MRHQPGHEAVGRAGAAQGRIGFDMDEGIGPVLQAIIGEDQLAVDILFETLAAGVVEDHG